MAGALEGVRYLDLARVGPGGHCSRILADMGADVIRVAEPAPSAARRAALPANGARTYSLRRNTRVIGLDLKSETGRAVFYRLAATADAMGVGFRPGTPKRLGIDYETMAKVNPRLVYCSMTGYGATGPYAGYAGHDINYQALAGLAALNGDPDHKPHPAGTVGDAAGGGMQGVIGILAAIVARDRTGRGQFVDAGATDGLLNLVHRWFEMEHETGVPVTRGSEMTLHKYAWYDTYETKDGKYVSVGAVEPYSMRTCAARWAARTSSTISTTTAASRRCAPPSPRPSAPAPATSGPRTLCPPTAASRRSTRSASSPATPTSRAAARSPTTSAPRAAVPARPRR